MTEEKDIISKLHELAKTMSEALNLNPGLNSNIFTENECRDNRILYNRVKKYLEREKHYETN